MAKLDLFRAPPLAPYNPGQIREAVRAVVALAASVTFFFVIWFYLRQAGKESDTSWLHVEDAMHAILPAVTSVLGTALGFYFGSQKR